jgi:mannose-1-phosphate guanylyltransferase/mannose-6-phosphate isomerase
MSRSQRPKQFLALTDTLSLFQLTLKRLSDPNRYSQPIIITNADYRFLVAEQALECGVELFDVILEPLARNTGPAITAATLIASADGPTLIHVVASDHNIDLDDSYFKSVKTATAAAQMGRLATFGITPTEPATGFGYIEAGEKEPSGAYAIKRFVEKPNIDLAREMIATGGFYWNSGMFLFRSDVFLNECIKYAPAVYQAAEASVESAHRDLDFIRLDSEEFEKSPDISVDYAIFENTKFASVVPSPIHWSDLGSWDSVWKESKQDADGNVARGPVSLHNTNNSLILSEGVHVAVNGIDDC